MESPRSASNLSSPKGGQGKGGLFCRLSRACAAHGSASLSVIIVLTLLIIVVYVYYHGLFGLGPYTSSKPHKKAGKRRKIDDDDPGGAGDDKADPETEKLIETINNQ